jgi:hypothetical protein
VEKLVQSRNCWNRDKDDGQENERGTSRSKEGATGQSKNIQNILLKITITY